MAIPVIGETSLRTLLQTLKLTLHPDTYVFLSLPADRPIPPTLEFKMIFKEAEGVTIIASRESAESHGLRYAFPCRMITLNVHSSLEAVGFMAVIAGRLKELNMGANPVSGYYHDHVFVPEGREGEAVQELEKLAAEAQE